MSEYTIDKFTYGGNTYNLQDSDAQRTLVSGTNIKTVNGVSLLGSGDVPVSGGSGTITGVKTTAGAHTAIDVSSGAATFNVPTKTSHLTNDSGFLTSHQTLYEANLNWGGKDFSAGYSPIDAAMIDILGANRFAFLKAAGLTIEYSTNGGSSYTDYGATDAQKVGLFSSGQSFYLGKHTANGSCTTNDRLRVTIATSAAGIYTVLNKIAIYMSTSGATVQVLIEKALESTPTTFQTHKDWTGISGWSGWNILNISGLTTYGNTASSQYGRIRFTFRQTAVNTNYSSANISKIMGFGGVGWTVPSTMAATGHLYSYDSSQNTTFPAKVTATSFSGNLTGNVTGNVSGSAGSVAWSGVGSKPTTLSGYGITDAKIANGVITLGSNTITPLTSFTETDPTVPSWAKASTKPTYTASEVGALASNTTYVSTITTTAGTHSAISSKSGAVSFNVPTKTSHLTNDSGFTTNTGTITGVTAGTGLSGGGTSGSVTLNHSNSITAGTIGSSSATSGATVSIPYATYDSNGHITGKGTHTHTITGFLTAETDPIFAASAAFGIDSSDISNWNNKLSGSSISSNQYMTIGDWKIMWGSVTMNSSSATGSGTFTAPYYNDKNITFSPAFQAIPFMYATVQGSWTGSRSVLCHDTSTTGSTIRMISSHKNSSDVTIRWLAIGRAL